MDKDALITVDHYRRALSFIKAKNERGHSVSWYTLRYFDLYDDQPGGTNPVKVLQQLCSEGYIDRREVTNGSAYTINSKGEQFLKEHPKG